MRVVAAAGLAIFACTGAAYAESGYFDVSRTSVDANLMGFDIDGDATAISGAVSLPLRGHLDFQVDLQAADLEDVDDTMLSGLAHLIGRNPGWMLGGFAGALDTDAQNAFVGGFEGALYFKRFTLASVLAYADSDELETNAVLFQEQGRYFVTRDLRLDVNLGYGDFESAGVSWDAWTYGAGAEFRFAETPISVFGTLTHIDADDSNFDGETFRFGLRYNLDPDLAYRDEAGASLATIPSLLGVY